MQQPLKKHVSATNNELNRTLTSNTSVLSLKMNPKAQLIIGSTMIFTGASSGTGVALGIQVGVKKLMLLSLKFWPQGSWDSTETATFSSC